MKNNKHILLVDDEKDLVDAVSSILSEEGFKTTKAYSGSQALQNYQQNNYDLVITDLKMPVMDGIELIREIRRINPSQKIIVVTGYSAQLMPWNTRLSPSQSMKERFDLGTIEYLIKPFRGKLLLKTISKVLAEPDTDSGQQKSLIDNYASVSGLTCEDLLLMYALEGADVILEIYNSTKMGQIFIKKGEIVHADSGAVQGEEALFDILMWATKKVVSNPVEDEVPRTINRNAAALLSEISRRKRNDD